MIRTIREGSQKHPWILKSIIGVIAVTFVGGMGWYGYEAARPNSVATIGPYAVSLDEYRRAKQNIYRFYQDQLQQEEIDEEQLKQMALSGLLEAKTWSILADQLDISITPEDLHNAIVSQKEFQRDGKFDPQIYQRLLQYNRMTPNQYEKQRTLELVRGRARLVAMEATTLTPAELKEVQALASRQGKEGEEPDAATLERTKQQFLFQKRQRAMQALQTAMRAKAHIQVDKELL
jgi:peptidyl-prolyl cis-trans isomerase D